MVEKQYKENKLLKENRFSETYETSVSLIHIEPEFPMTKKT